MYLSQVNMRLRQSSITSLSLTLILFLPSFISSQTCQKTCGQQLIKYPFGTGPGCGDPRFQSYITCNQKQLTFATHTGCYPITSIDYDTQVIYITDPTMSTCSFSQPSKGFGLDWNAPFSFHDDTVFALLDCSVTSSPIYKSNGGTGNNNNNFTMCDPQGAHICSLLYTCQAVSRLDMSISTCCVYAPVNLGPSFEMNLQKLQCSSYSGLYGFNGQESNPESWKYGVALKYKFSFNNDYPILCGNCEKSNGVCGYKYNEPYNPFVCNCPTGLNTTEDCFYVESWNSGFQQIPLQTGISVIYSLAWFLILVFV